MGADFQAMVIISETVLLGSTFVSIPAWIDIDSVGKDWVCTWSIILSMVGLAREIQFI